MKLVVTDGRLLADDLRLRVGLGDPLTDDDLAKIDALLMFQCERSIAIGVAELRQWNASEQELESFARSRRESFQAKRHAEMRRVVEFVTRHRTAGPVAPSTVQ